MIIRLRLLEQRYAICRLAADADVPRWAAGEFVSITRTPDELSVVCREADVPNDVTAERGWRCFAVEGPIPFEIPGIAAAIAAPLSGAAISVFLVSTFDTDYLLVKEAVLETATAVLRNAGIVIG